MKNIAGKMVKVMTELKRVAKNGRNDHFKYDYVTESDVMDAVRTAMENQNLAIFTSVEMSHREGNLTSVVTKHTIVDADSGEHFEIKGFGQGSDNSDKGGPKAITSAVKYALLKTFLLSSGDDPEATDEAGKSTGTVKTKAVAAVATGTTGKATYGFSNRAKTTTTVTKAVVNAEPEMNTDDSF